MGMEGVNIPTQDVPRCGPPNLLEISSVRLLPLATSNPWPPKALNLLAAKLGTPGEIRSISNPFQIVQQFIILLDVGPPLLIYTVCWEKTLRNTNG
jgi:hypothetical protein